MNPTGAFFLGAGLVVAVEAIGAFLAWMDWQPKPQARPKTHRHLTIEPSDETPVRPRDPDVIHLVDRLAQNAESRGDYPGGRAS